MPKLISPNVTFVSNGVTGKNSYYLDKIIDGEYESTIYPNGAVVIEPDFEIIDLKDVDNLFYHYEARGHLYPVGRSGLKGEETVGSHRFCTINDALANALYEIIVRSDAFPSDHGNFTFTEVSPYFRFMRYEGGGEHYPHYDSDFPMGDGQETKYSMVIYFTRNNSGQFAFVNDPRENHGNTDWDRQATEQEIDFTIAPRQSRIVLFPHTLCHTVLPLLPDDGQRIIARGDLIFTKKRTAHNRVLQG